MVAGASSERGVDSLIEGGLGLIVGSAGACSSAATSSMAIGLRGTVLDVVAGMIEGASIMMDGAITPP